MGDSGVSDVLVRLLIHIHANFVLQICSLPKSKWRLMPAPYQSSPVVGPEQTIYHEMIISWLNGFPCPIFSYLILFSRCRNSHASQGISTKWSDILSAFQSFSHSSAAAAHFQHSYSGCVHLESNRKGHRLQWISKTDYPKDKCFLYRRPSREGQLQIVQFQIPPAANQTNALRNKGPFSRQIKLSAFRVGHCVEQKWGRPVS